MTLLGPDGLLAEGAVADGGRTGIHTMFLQSPAATIAGGTSEIMRNILGERVLGLPGEPRADKDLPWSQVPRN